MTRAFRQVTGESPSDRTGTDKMVKWRQVIVDCRFVSQYGERFL